MREWRSKQAARKRLGYRELLQRWEAWERYATDKRCQAFVDLVTDTINELRKRVT